MASGPQSLTGVFDIEQTTRYPEDLTVNDAVFHVAAAAILAFGGSDSISSSSFDGPGTTRILGEANLTGVDVDDDATLANGGSVVQSGIVNDGSLIRNLTTWSVDAGAEIAGADPAAQFVNFGAFDALGAPTDTNLISTNFLDYGTLDYAGTLEFSGPNTLINVGGLPLGLADAGTRIMAINGGIARFLWETFPAEGGGGHFGGGGGGGQFIGGVNSVLTVSGAETQVRFLYDSASMYGAFSFRALDVTDGATIFIGAGAQVGFVNLVGSTIAGVIRGPGDLSASGDTIAFASGARVLVSADVGEADVSGRVVAGSESQPFIVEDVELDAGRLVLSGGEISGQIGGQGQVVNDGVLQLFGWSPDGALDDSVALVNNQDLLIGGAAAQNDITMSAGDTIVNNAGAHMVWETEFLFKLTGGTIVNDGSIEMRSMAAPPDVPSYGVADISSTVQNNGDIASGAGIEFDNAVAGTGEDRITDVDLQGTLLSGVQGPGFTFDGAVGAGQSIVFTDADQTLTLNDVSAFEGEVRSFAATGSGDAIVVDTSAWMFTGFSENADNSAGTLNFANNGADIGVTLTGVYTASGFAGLVSGQTTTITYTPPA